MRTDRPIIRAARNHSAAKQSFSAAPCPSGQLPLHRPCGCAKSPPPPSPNVGNTLANQLCYLSLHVCSAHRRHGAPVKQLRNALSEKKELIGRLILDQTPLLQTIENSRTKWILSIGSVIRPSIEKTLVYSSIAIRHCSSSSSDTPKVEVISCSGKKKRLLFRVVGGVDGEP